VGPDRPHGAVPARTPGDKDMTARHYLLAATLFAAAPAHAAVKVTQTNLVSDGYTTAAFTDPNLKNPWGISYSPSGPFWVSDNATGLTTVYQGTGSIDSLVVTIPAAGGGSGTGSPDGQVYNATSGFAVSQNGKSGAALFIFTTEDGTISGWSPSVNPSTAVVAVDNSAKAAVYKGVAFYSTGGKNYLLVTNFWSGMIEVYDSDFAFVTSFRDTGLPNSWSPYNVAVLSGNIFVTYAKADKQRHDSVSGKGLGAVEEISFTGQVLARYQHGALNAPWGLALAPSGFGKIGGDLLVGNFGSGTVAVFTTALAPHGVLHTTSGAQLVIPGLWGLIPGNGGSGGAANTIYFAAGPNNEQDGLFGALAYSP
jgi:uncharacterized protein (TIGR03118 family)